MFIVTLETEESVMKLFFVMIENPLTGHYMKPSPEVAALLKAKLKDLLDTGMRNSIGNNTGYTS